MLGMPGMRIVSAMTSRPTTESFTNAAAVGAQSTTGAKTSQMPTKQAAHQVTGRSGRSARHPSATSSAPLTTSDQVISRARSDSYVAVSANHAPRPPLGCVHSSSLR